MGGDISRDCGSASIAGLSVNNANLRRKGKL